MSIGLFDSNFTHSHPEFERGSVRNATVFTDQWLTAASGIRCPSKIAWLVEPQVINPSAYVWIRENYARFHKVCGSDMSLGDLPNFHYVPFGGCWIDPRDRGLGDKTREVSIIASHKRNTYGQNLRHVVAEKFPHIDRFGSQATLATLGEKADWLKPYRYSVIIENSQVAGYFTEKLLDCLVCGTTPLYWGDPTITDVFETVVPFDDLDQLAQLLEARPEFSDEAKARDWRRAEHYADPLENLYRVIA